MEVDVVVDDGREVESVIDENRWGLVSLVSTEEIEIPSSAVGDIFGIVPWLSDVSSVDMTGGLFDILQKMEFEIVCAQLRKNPYKDLARSCSVDP